MDEIDYSDARINQMPQLMDLDTVMTNELPFERFKKFMKARRMQHDEVFLNLYCLIQIYNNKIQNLNMQYNALKNKNNPD